MRKVAYAANTWSHQLMGNTMPLSIGIEGVDVLKNRQQRLAYASFTLAFCMVRA
jgi:hypothetical protein